MTNGITTDNWNTSPFDHLGTLGWRIPPVEAETSDRERAEDLVQTADGSVDVRTVAQRDRGVGDKRRVRGDDDGVQVEFVDVDLRRSRRTRR